MASDLTAIEVKLEVLRLARYTNQLEGFPFLCNVNKIVDFQLCLWNLIRHHKGVIFIVFRQILMC